MVSLLWISQPHSMVSMSHRPVISKPTLPLDSTGQLPRTPATPNKVPNWLALSRLSQTVPEVLVQANSTSIFTACT